jgi:DNA-binding NtrC family response regulator
MTAGRGGKNNLVKVLQSLAQPVALVGPQRNLVFANDACAAWLGVASAELHGRICRYQSAATDAIERAADSLCPPPEAFTGQCASGLVSAALADGTFDQRRAQFLPLADQTAGSFCVLVLIDESNEGAAGETLGDAANAHADEARQLHEQLAGLRHEMGRLHRIDRLVGQSPAMARVRAQVQLAAETTANVLIVGPPGVGRQHVARTIHEAGPPPRGAFSTIDCAVLPPELLESALASLVPRRNQPASATAAKVLLTEVQTLPLELQSELARLLASPTRTVRFIVTAAEPLGALAAAGTFRGDLAEMLGTLVIELPPLAARRDDLPLVVQMLVEDHNAANNKQLRGCTAEALDRLVQFDWPGQFDQLAAVVQEACARADGVEITLADLPKRLHQAAEAARFVHRPPPTIDLEKFLAQVETELIERALRLAKGNKTQAAKLLGLNRPRLYRRMVQLGLAEEAEDESSDEGVKG